MALITSEVATGGLTRRDENGNCIICGVSQCICIGDTPPGPIYPPVGSIMGVSIVNKGAYVAEERLYLNSQAQAVPASDPDRQTLLAAAGTRIPLEKAREVGLIGGDEEGAEAKSVLNAPEDKSVKGPKETK